MTIHAPDGRAARPAALQRPPAGRGGVQRAAPHCVADYSGSEWRISQPAVLAGGAGPGQGCAIRPPITAGASAAIVGRARRSRPDPFFHTRRIGRRGRAGGPVGAAGGCAPRGCGASGSVRDADWTIRAQIYIAVIGRFRSGSSRSSFYGRKRVQKTECRTMSCSRRRVPSGAVMATPRSNGGRSCGAVPVLPPACSGGVGVAGVAAAPAHPQPRTITAPRPSGASRV